MANLLLTNAEIINADSRQRADILVESGTITRIGTGLTAPEGTEVVDAAGRYVFPGFVDPHVHIHLPFMGTYAKDTYESASKAAVVGGTTSLIEMCVPGPTDGILASFEHWKGLAEGKSACDYTFHMGVPRWDEGVESDLAEVQRAGIASLKLFLAYKGVFALPEADLYAVMKHAGRHGLIVTAHCENADLVALRQQALIAAGHTEPGYHEVSRPPEVEVEGVHRLATYAGILGTHIYTVHTSCRESVEAGLRARERGVRIWIETLIQYLTHDKTDAERPDFEGAKYVMSPPLRDKANQDYLWNALQQGLVDTLATDHAPFDFHGQKDMGREDFTKIPNGIPSLEDRVTVLYTKGVKEGRLDLHRFVEVASTASAEIFGLEGKGAVAVGKDADLVLWDDDYRGTISAERQYMAVDYNPYEGWEIQGRPAMTWVRGEKVAEDGRFTGTLGHGQFLRREPTHFVPGH